MMKFWNAIPFLSSLPMKSSPSYSANEFPSVRPLILLDVDGVINYRGNDHWTDSEELCGITCSRTVVNKINEWSTKAEIRWLTAWNQRAQSELTPALGLNFFELARDPTREFSKEMAAFLNHKEDPTRPLCWIDDDLGRFSLDVELWSKRHPTLFVKPNEDEGLTPDDISRIDQFLADPDRTKNNFLEVRKKRE